MNVTRYYTLEKIEVRRSEQAAGAIAETLHFVSVADVKSPEAMHLPPHFTLTLHRGGMGVPLAPGCAVWLATEVHTA